MSEFYCWEDTYKRRLLRIRAQTRALWRMFLGTAGEHRSGRVSRHGHTPKARLTSQLDSSSSSRKERVQGLKLVQLFYLLHSLLLTMPIPCNYPWLQTRGKETLQAVRVWMQAPQWRVIKYSICSLLVVVYSWKIKWFSQTLILTLLLEKAHRPLQWTLAATF